MNDSDHVILTSSQDIQEHILKYSSDAFKRTIRLQYPPEIKLSVLDVEAVSSLVQHKFVITKVQYVSNFELPKYELFNQILRVICASNRHGDSLEVIQSGKGNKDRWSMFNQVNVSAITGLDVSATKSIPLIHSLLSIFSSSNQLRSLNLSGIMFDKAGCESLLHYLSLPSCLISHLNVSHCGLPGTGLAVGLLSQAMSLTSLNISNNSFHQSEALLILNALSDHPGLKSLDMSLIVLSDIVAELCEAVSKSHIDMLQLSGCRISVAAFFKQFNDMAFISHSRKVFKYLDLSENDMDEMLPYDCFSHVESLNLRHSFNASKMSSEAWLTVCKVISRSSVLRHLSLEHCGLNGDHIWTLLSSMKESIAHSLSTTNRSLTAGAMKVHPHYGFFSIFKTLTEAYDTHLTSEDDIGWIRTKLEIMVRVFGSYISYAGTADMSDIQEAFSLIQQERYEELGERLCEPSTEASIYQAIPGVASPFSVPSLECLSIRGNVNVGFSGALAVADFIMVHFELLFSLIFFNNVFVLLRVFRVILYECLILTAVQSVISVVKFCHMP